MLFAGFDRKAIPVGDISINCVIGGKGYPVLLLHGYPQCLAMWAKVAPQLAEDYTVVCADLRGYGDSSKPHAAADCANYSFRAMADDQVGVIKALGFTRFHVAGHDRGGRTAHRMALDYPDVVRSMTVLDIVPTHAMFTQLNRALAQRYWHWFFLSKPAPFPERLIGADPDFYYESAIGASDIDRFDPEQLAEYRRCWRNPEMIHGSCADYRAAILQDLVLDSADYGKRKVTCPALAIIGGEGALATAVDASALWRAWCTDVRTTSLPAGHFLIDHMPDETATLLRDFCGASKRSAQSPRHPERGH